jgi:hypothetical protein
MAESAPTSAVPSAPAAGAPERSEPLEPPTASTIEDAVDKLMERAQSLVMNACAMNADKVTVDPASFFVWSEFSSLCLSLSCFFLWLF